MSVKIKVSYEHPEELQHVLDRLQPNIESFRVSGNQEGRYRKAYIVWKKVESETVSEA